MARPDPLGAVLFLFGASALLYYLGVKATVVVWVLVLAGSLLGAMLEWW